MTFDDLTYLYCHMYDHIFVPKRDSPWSEMKHNFIPLLNEKMGKPCRISN